jgi:hypothetical protein
VARLGIVQNITRATRIRQKAIEKTILRILLPSTFSHSLGQFRKSAVVSARSALPSGTDVVSRTGYVRKVPVTDLTGVHVPLPPAADIVSFCSIG